MQRDTLVGEAFALAADVHRNQFDKAGEPYILHPVAVMQRVTEFYQRTGGNWNLHMVQATALLHDVFEDIKPEDPWQHARLRDRVYQLNERVYSAVDALTKRPRQGDYVESYDEYLDRVEQDWIARIVKMVDLSHNLEAFRLPEGRITEKDFQRWEKYHRAFVRLAKLEAAAHV